MIIRVKNVSCFIYNRIFKNSIYSNEKHIGKIKFLTLLEKKENDIMHQIETKGAK